MRSAGRFARRRGVGEQGTKVPAFARRERPPGIVTALILLVIGILATSAPSPAGASTTPGQLFAFGRNVFGQLGNTTNNNSEEPNPTPTPVTLPGEDGPVTQAAAGVGFSLAVTSSGQLYAFGENRFGQLGTSTNDKTTEPNPTPTPVTLPGEDGPVTQVAAGGTFGLALTSSGQLYAFGENDFGQLGRSTNNKTTEPNPTPTPVGLPGLVGSVIEIAAGADYSLALTSSGQLYTFGRNSAGELGNAENNTTSEPNPTPTLVTLPDATGVVSQIGAGSAASLALTASGQLYTFGFNYFGELGYSTNEKTVAPNPTPTPVVLPAAFGPVVQIDGVGGASAVLSSSGTLYTFGANLYGQLGYATNDGTNEPNPMPTPVAFPGDTTIETLARGPDGEHTLVITADLAVTTAALPGGTSGRAYSAAVRASGGTPPYTWSASGLPPGLSMNLGNGVLAGTPTAVGTFKATVTASDHGGIQASAPITVTIAPAETAPPPPPTLTSVRQSHTAWREGAKLAQISSKPPVGTTFSFSLNERATVTMTFKQLLTGRIVGGRCIAQSRRNRRRRACNRTVAAGTLSFNGNRGPDNVVFQGRISGSKRLEPGRFMLVIAASDADGEKATPQTLKFTILK